MLSHQVEISICECQELEKRKSCMIIEGVLSVFYGKKKSAFEDELYLFFHNTELL